MKPERCYYAPHSALTLVIVAHDHIHYFTSIYAGFQALTFGSTRQHSVARLVDMQEGQLFQRNGAWHLRYYRDEIVDGKRLRKRISKRIAPVNDQYRRPKDLKTKVDDELRSVNEGKYRAEGEITIAAFFDSVFLRHIQTKRKASTARFYKVTFDLYLRAPIGDVRLNDFSTGMAQRLLDSISLSHQSLLRIKTAMSAIFSYAIRLEYYTGANPVREAKAEGKRTHPDRYAYTLNEVRYILGKLSEPARTVCAVAAFSGLRESEIRGLKWQDYSGKLLFVRRAIWRTHVEETKTPESESSVPVIGPLRKLLDLHKRRNGHGDWMFAGEKKGFSLNLDNLCARDIRPVLKDRWHGWHAFRRGLATNLWELGVPAEVAQIILRHADVATTRKHYLLLSSRHAGNAAMRKLEKEVASWATNGQQRKARKSRKPA